MSKNKLSKIRRNDPHFKAESEKYDAPLPSRPYILEMLEKEGRPLFFDELAALLDIQKHEFEPFTYRLSAMQRDAELMRNRKGAYIVPSRADLIRGRIEGHADGYGFLIPDSGGEDIFLSAKEMRKVLHKDRALVRVMGEDRKGRKEGAIVEVLERVNRSLVGRVFVEHGVVRVRPEDRRINQDVLIVSEPAKPKKNKAGAPQTGQVVSIEILEQPSRHSQPIGRITEVLGNYADDGMEIEIALRKHDLPFVFPEEAEAEAKKLPAKLKKTDYAGREDLRDLPLVTIDGETARDFDDAVYAEPDGKTGFRLIVAIADVSAYVRDNMALDKEAYARGNSVYFPRRVIPMLPEKLSNGLCSLNPEVDRLAMICDMKMSSTGKIKSYQFYPAVIASKARLTYTQVWDWLSDATQAETATEKAVFPHLLNLYKLYQILLKARHKRGAIDFETVETQMIFNEEGKIDKIIPSVRNEAHRIIEECMLAANVCASDFLEKNKQPCLYRIHQGPTPEKLEKLRGFLKEFGFGLPGGDAPKAADYAALLEKVKERPDAALLQTAMLRSLRQAMYSPDNEGHFGLSYEHYTHFTSPIRRYPDLLVHRAILAVLQKTKYKPQGKAGKKETLWEDIGLHCSMTERRADEATRDVNNWLKCYYMQDRVGETFTASVSAVVPFGVFVAPDGVYVEGLVHVSELGSDYFKYDPIRHEMLGERTAKRFRLGDRMTVKLVRADLETGRIDFVPTEAMPQATKREANEKNAVTDTARKPAKDAATKPKAPTVKKVKSAEISGKKKKAAVPKTDAKKRR